MSNVKKVTSWLRNKVRSLSQLAIKTIVWIFIDRLWGFLSWILGKVEIWVKSTILRHWIFAFMTMVLIGSSIELNGIISVNTMLVMLYFIYTWSAIYFVVYLVKNTTIKIIWLKMLSKIIFALTFIVNMIIVPIIFDLIYFKDSLYIDNGSLVTLLMFILIFISPSLLIVGVRGLTDNVPNCFNYRRFVIVMLTVFTVLKVINDFEIIYSRAYNDYQCDVEADSNFCEVEEDSYVSFDNNPTLWMMNQVIYQSMVIVFLIDNVLPKKEYLKTG